MVSISPLILEPVCMLLSDFGIGSPGKKALPRVRVRSRDIARAKVTPVL